ncbi:MAG: hypothetical protein VX670_11795, partial [Candidatus Latescibacterota bacterium]|nr:hypothetical protein [Candidatus Latescibacterota bacterium]
MRGGGGGGVRCGRVRCCVGRGRRGGAREHGARRDARHVRRRRVRRRRRERRRLEALRRGVDQLVGVRDDELHDGARRTRLQHIEPPTQHLVVLGLVGLVRGHQQQVERAGDQVLLLAGRVLRL